MAPNESLSHVLGQCRSVKCFRITRHNRISQFLTRNCSKDWQILCETRLQLDGHMYIPDLVFHGNGKAICVDVTVRYEQMNGSLSKAIVICIYLYFWQYPIKIYVLKSGNWLQLSLFLFDTSLFYKYPYSPSQPYAWVFVVIEPLRTSFIARSRHQSSLTDITTY